MRPLKINLLFLFLATTLCFNCSDDDDDMGLGNSSDFPQLIVGSWRFASGTTDGNPTMVQDQCELQFTFSFAADGNFTTTSFSGPNCATSTQGSGTYSISGNVLTLNTTQGSGQAEITGLNSSTLSVRYEDDNGSTIVENYNKI
ncbi:MAG: lipocalin family protein [Bacteroidota bacterium]